LLRLSRELLEEAKIDLGVRCFSKAASASYFSARMACELLLREIGEVIPRRDDKLANAIANKGLTEESELLSVLYVFRKRADYGEGVSEGEAREAVQLAERIISRIEEFLSGT